MQCPKCAEVFPSATQLEEHMKKRHEKHGCEICGKSFERKDNLKRHSKTHASPNSKRSFPCNQCGEKFQRSDTLRKHVVESHGEIHLCEICGKRFQILKNLTNHMKTHEVQEPESVANERHMCEICGQQFERKGDLKRHLKIHASPNSKQTFPCKQCGKKFRRKDNLQKHLDKEHGEAAEIPQRRIRCRKCQGEVYFGTRRELVRHQLMDHTNDGDLQPSPFAGKNRFLSDISKLLRTYE